MPRNNCSTSKDYRFHGKTNRTIVNELLFVFTSCQQLLFYFSRRTVEQRQATNTSDQNENYLTPTNNNNNTDHRVNDFLIFIESYFKSKLFYHGFQSCFKSII